MKIKINLLLVALLVAAVGQAQDAGRKYINVASQVLAGK